MVPPRRTVVPRNRSVGNSRRRSTPDRSDSAATMRGARHAELSSDWPREVTNQFADRSKFDIATYGLRVAAGTVAVVSYGLHYLKSSDAVLARQRSGDGVYMSRDGVSPKLRLSEPLHGREAGPFVLEVDFPRTAIGFESHDPYDCTTPCDRLYKRRRTLLQVLTPVAVLPRGALSSRLQTTNTPLQYSDVDTTGFYWNCEQSRESHLTCPQVVDSEPFARGCYRIVCTVHSGSYSRSYT